MKLTNNRPDFLKRISYLLPPNPVCVEIGVDKGEFSQLILDNLNPSKLFLVDPWSPGSDKNDSPTYGSGIPTAYSTNEDYKLVYDKFYNQIIKNKVILRVDFSYNVVQDFPDDYFDFIYIDSCHLYGAVKADLNMFLPKLKRRGLMCGHDYFKGLPELGLEFGVIEAVDEFCKDENFDLFLLNENDYDWALRKN